MPFTEATLAGWVGQNFDAAAEAHGFTGGDLMRAMEDAWSSCLCIPATPQPDCIIVNSRFMLAYRRAMRPPRHRVGGSSLRAVKRRAVRRPW